jgi:hypothetical protein
MLVFYEYIIIFISSKRNLTAILLTYFGIKRILNYNVWIWSLKYIMNITIKQNIFILTQYKIM